MRTARVTVVPYDEGWKADFEAIRCELAAALGELSMGIEHVGSTSVEGLAAKPCIDLDVIIRDYGDLPLVVERLAEIGYTHEGDLGICGREAFCYESKPHLKTHHLYVCPMDSRELKRHLTFRDFLRSHPEAAKHYGEVKQRAAALFSDQIDKYMEYKSSCIAQLYVACGLEEKEEKEEEKGEKEA